MARVAFIQNLAFEYLGLMYLAAVLKKNNHKVEIFIGNNVGKIADQVKHYEADLAGFPCTSGNESWCLKAAEAVKAKTKALTIFGGPHPTFSPEMIMSPSVDIVCRGESENAILEVSGRLDSGSDLTVLSNCWLKKNGAIIKNEVGPLIEDLDTLPFPDRDMYYAKHSFLNTPQKRFIAGRGCPFKCSYCFNEPLRVLYEGKGGKYVRYRSVEKVLEEIKYVRKRYGLGSVYMVDDLFVLNKPWVYDFLDRYAREIRLPLICMIRADLLTEDTVKRLKDACCYSVSFGIESGNERLRNEVLCKNIGDEKIIAAAALLRKYKIKFKTFNILGIPEETLSDALETVGINSRIKTDYPYCSILQPYPKTRIEGYACEKKVLRAGKRHYFLSFFQDSIIASKYRRELVNLQKLFFFAVKFPGLLPVIKLLIKLPANLFFDLIFMTSYAHIYIKSANLKLGEFIGVGVRNLRFFLR